LSSNISILFEDNHLLVIRKPSGMLTQGDQTGDPNLLDWGKDHLKKKYNKPGQVFLGLVHRLDRPVSGVMVFARTSKAAARLSDQIRNRTIQKQYWALVEGQLPQSGQLEHHLARRQSKSRVVEPPQGQLAKLSYQCIDFHNNISWLEIQLHTGRHHQIRVQFAHIGHTLIGDYKYGSRKPYPNRSFALHAQSLTFNHPTTQETLTFKADPDPHWFTVFGK
jgi:23S rRNA pseudouridine1911/1915/1917 synthase